MEENKLTEEVNEILQKKLEKKPVLDIGELVYGYQLAAKSEGKSPKTIAAVWGALRSLERFLVTNELSLEANRIGVNELRRYIVYLQSQPRFASHRFIHPQSNGLSGHTINCYVRSLSAFWSWLLQENLISENPFKKLKVPKAPRKVIGSFTEEQMQKLFSAIDTSSTVGFRDYTIMLTLYDTGIRSAELINLKITDIDYESRQFKVLGKGSKERYVPFGAKVQKELWKYTKLHRPQPASALIENVFLTDEGRSLQKDRLLRIIKNYGDKAGIKGIRISPHTLRHTMAITFLRNGGNIFALQRILGHSSLEMTRRYCELGQSDIAKQHQENSPGDRLTLRPTGPVNRGRIVRPGGKTIISE